MRPAGRTVVAVLTDEELTVLTDGEEDVVVRPHLDSLPELDRDRARRTAARSLTARGLLLPLGEDLEPSRPLADLQSAVAEAEGAVAVRVHEDLAPVLEVRRGAPVVVVLHRMSAADIATPLTTTPLTTTPLTTTPPITGPGGPTTDTADTCPMGLLRYLFLVDEVCLVEDVTDQGVHTLSVGAARRTGDWLGEFLVPPGAAAAQDTEPVQPGPRSAVAQVLHRLGDPVVLAEVSVLDPCCPPPERGGRVLFIGPGGCYETDADSRVDGPFRPTSPEAMVCLLQADIDQARARVGQHFGDRAGGSTMGP